MAASRVVSDGEILGIGASWRLLLCRVVDVKIDVNIAHVLWRR
jgi:hypothetical protein